MQFICHVIFYQYSVSFYHSSHQVFTALVLMSEPFMSVGRFVASPALMMRASPALRAQTLHRAIHYRDPHIVDNAQPITMEMAFLALVSGQRIAIRKHLNHLLMRLSTSCLCNIK